MKKIKLKYNDGMVSVSAGQSGRFAYVKRELVAGINQVSDENGNIFVRNEEVRGLGSETVCFERF